MFFFHNIRVFQGVTRPFNRTLSDVGQQQNGAQGHNVRSAGRKRYLVPLNDSVSKGVDITRHTGTRSLSANAKTTVVNGKLHQKVSKPPRVGFGDWSQGVTSNGSDSPDSELSPETIVRIFYIFCIFQLSLRAVQLTYCMPINSCKLSILYICYLSDTY